jgi:hypothetical protein
MEAKQQVVEDVANATGAEVEDEDVRRLSRQILELTAPAPATTPLDLEAASANGDVPTQVIEDMADEKAAHRTTTTTSTSSIGGSPRTVMTRPVRGVRRVVGDSAAPTATATTLTLPPTPNKLTRGITAPAAVAATQPGAVAVRGVDAGVENDETESASVTGLMLYDEENPPLPPSVVQMNNDINNKNDHAAPTTTQVEHDVQEEEEERHVGVESAQQHHPETAPTATPVDPLVLEAKLAPSSSNHNNDHVTTLLAENERAQAEKERLQQRLETLAKLTCFSFHPAGAPERRAPPPDHTTNFTRGHFQTGWVARGNLPSYSTTSTSSPIIKSSRAVSSALHTLPSSVSIHFAFSAVVQTQETEPAASRPERTPSSHHSKLQIQRAQRNFDFHCLPYAFRQRPGLHLQSLCRWGAGGDRASRRGLLLAPCNT